MSDFDRNYAAPRRGVGADRAVAIDQGLPPSPLPIEGRHRRALADIAARAAEQGVVPARLRERHVQDEDRMAAGVQATADPTGERRKRALQLWRGRV